MPKLNNFNNIFKNNFSVEVGGRKLMLYFSDIVSQANASVLAEYGETSVLVTAVMSKDDVQSNYFPLRVDYEERFYAAGKIMGSRFIRREGRPSEEAILAARLLDRTIRPLFDDRLRREIQIVATVLSIDEENDPDFVGLVAASACLAVSDIPWNGPVGGVRIAKIKDKFIINPKTSDIKDPDFNFEIFASGPKGKVNMIEMRGIDAEEKDVLEAVSIAQEEIDKIVNFQNTVVGKIGKGKKEILLYEPDRELRNEAEKFLSNKLDGIFINKNKAEINNEIDKLKKELFSYMSDKFDDADESSLEFLFERKISDLVHKNILEKGIRPDGRDVDEIRELNGAVGLFERTHGSALFMRGKTHALAVTTLAPPGAEQLVETIETSGKRRFMLHYNFPPYSVGEIGVFRGPGRREIGHGALAEKSISSIIPSMNEFPYTIRVVSEILSSNGSSSMATVCASVMSLMDAGVPIKKAAAGIAMGIMISENEKTGETKYKILTDIQGPEDHYGDMDFKVAGTKDGITAIQLDTKVNGINLAIIEETLKKAKTARLKILDFMSGIVSSPRSKISKYAPVVLQTEINPDKIGLLIGTGGKTINSIIKKWNLDSIDTSEDGKVFVSAMNPDMAENAMNEIETLTHEFKVGDIISGKVVKILEFGAIVDLGGGQEGMIHISELKNGYVKKVEDVVKIGDIVKAKIIGIDPNSGKISLSLKETGQGANGKQLSL